MKLPIYDLLSTAMNAVSLRDTKSVMFYRCKFCGSLVLAAGSWRDIFLRCSSCKSRISDRRPVLTNPLAILETPGAGTSSYVACLHMLLMANSKGVRSTDVAFTRMTRVKLHGEPLPAWSVDQWLPEDVYEPFTFNWGGREYDLVAGPARKQSWRRDADLADREWLRILRACRGLIVSLRADITRSTTNLIPQTDQELATRLREIFVDSHRIENVVLMFNAADLVSSNSDEAEFHVSQLMQTYFHTVQAVCANERIRTFATPTSTWGFGITHNGVGRFPPNCKPFNIIEPIRCGLGRIPASNGTFQSGGRENGLQHIGSPEAYRFEVALSYAGEDREYVEQVAAVLQDKGIRLFYDRHETADIWGEDLAARMSEIFGKQAKYVVLFLSKHYVQNAWTLHERRHAQAQLAYEDINRLLPARFDDTELPGLNADIAYLDLRSLNPEEVAEHIVRKLRSDGDN